MQKEIIWNEEKNEVLKSTRNISFELIAQKIVKKEIIQIAKNNNSNYPNQYIIIINHENYTWVVPCLIGEKEIFLKTAFPSRKIHKKLK